MKEIQIWLKKLKDYTMILVKYVVKRLDLGDRFYSEVHHVQPLYLNGPDISENMIVLCPNHHVLFDRGAISIDLNLGKVRYLNGVEENINIKNYNIAKEYMDFHNKNIFNKSKDIKLEKLFMYYKNKPPQTHKKVRGKVGRDWLKSTI